MISAALNLWTFTMFVNNPVSPILLLSNREKILVSHEYSDEINSNWFLPTFWEQKALKVGSGGRGMTWFINNKDGNHWVLRFYGRGGLVVHFNKRTHLFINDRFVRAFKEFRLLVQMYNAGLNVPRPIAAHYYKVGGCWYHAAILLERIHGASVFAEHLYTANERVWRRIGHLVRTFHDHDVYHADLNCHNILISDSGLYLIDFDKSKFKVGEQWKRRNLQRLRRSIDKQIHKTPQPLPIIEALWEKLLSGYFDRVSNGSLAI